MGKAVKFFAAPLTIERFHTSSITMIPSHSYKKQTSQLYQILCAKCAWNQISICVRDTKHLKQNFQMQAKVNSQQWETLPPETNIYDFDDSIVEHLEYVLTGYTSAIGARDLSPKP